MYLNEDEAQLDIENIVGEHTQDFKLTLVKKKADGLKRVSCFFVLKAKKDEGNILFRALMLASARDERLKLLESEFLEEDRTIKELFLIECSISLYGE